MKSDNICVETSEDSVLVVDAPKTEENPCIIWKTAGIFGLEEVVGGKSLFHFTDDNVRSATKWRPSLWKVTVKECGFALWSTLLGGRLPGTPSGLWLRCQTGSCREFCPNKTSLKSEETSKTCQNTGQGCEVFFCDRMLLELRCISAADVLLDSNFSVFWFNSSDSGRIFFEWAGVACSLASNCYTFCCYFAPTKRVTAMCKRNTFSSVNTTVKGKKKINQLIILSLAFKKCVKTLSACVTYVHGRPYRCTLYIQDSFI